MKNDPKRATGRTLGLALQALGKAVENPGTEDARAILDIADELENL